MWRLGNGLKAEVLVESPRLIAYSVHDNESPTDGAYSSHGSRQSIGEKFTTELLATERNAERQSR